MSNTARRHEARERARLEREKRRRAERRAVYLIRSGVIAGVLALVVVVAIVIVSSIKPAGPGPLNMASDGITIAKGLKAERTGALAAGASPTDQPTSTPSPEPGQPAVIQLFVDYQCPICAQFEKQNGDYLKGLIESGAATVAIHPLAILDRSSLGTKYSTRAAAAAACVANDDPDSYYAFQAALFTRQPAEGTSGLTNAQLKSLVSGVPGLSRAKAIGACIDDQRFAPWVTAATQRALTQKIPGTTADKIVGTPTIFVDGQQFDGTKQTFEQFVTSIVGESDEGTD